jgi:hypothetical protein
MLEPALLLKVEQRVRTVVLWMFLLIVSRARHSVFVVYPCTRGLRNSLPLCGFQPEGVCILFTRFYNNSRWTGTWYCSVWPFLWNKCTVRHKYQHKYSNTECQMFHSVLTNQYTQMSRCRCRKPCYKPGLMSEARLMNV